MSTSPLEQLSGLAGILGVANDMAGGTKRQTQTQQTDLSMDAMNRLLNQILAGPGGVKDIGGAARGAGLYNSSTETQLLNDLYTRASGEVAARAAPTTTTTEAESVGGLSIGDIGLGLGAAVLAGPMLQRGLGALAGLAGLGGSAAPILGDAVQPAVSGALSSLGDWAGMSLAGAGSTAVNTAATGAATAGSSIPFIGNILSGLFGGGPQDPLSAVVAAAPATLALGPAGLAAPAVGTIAGDIGNMLSIICTALRVRGLLDDKLYSEGQQYLKTLHPRTVSGYRYWATGIAAKIMDEDGKSVQPWTDRCLPWAESRTKLLADKSNSILKYFKYPRGTLTKFIGEPICYLIGIYVEKKVKRNFQGA